MDLIGKAIYSILSADVTLNGLVSNRIYPVIARQQEVYPILTYAIITNTPSDTKMSASTVDRYRIQFDAYADNYDTCHAIMIRLREVIDRYPHLVISDIALDGISYLDQNDGFDDDPQLFRVTADYYMRIKRVPAGSPVEPPYSGFNDGIVNECYDVHTFHFTLVGGQSSVDVGFLIDSGHLVFAAETGPLIHGQEYTTSGTQITLTAAPFPDDIRIAVVRNRVRLRTFTQPSNVSTLLIGGLVHYPLLVFVDGERKIAGTDYTINVGTMQITWLIHPGVEFDFTIVANACTL